MTVTCNDPRHEARRRMRAEYAREGIDLTELYGAMYGDEWWSPADLRDGKPCLICGAPINAAGDGHDDGCMGLDS